MQKLKISLAMIFFLFGSSFINSEVIAEDKSLSIESHSHSKKKSNLPHFPFVSYPIGFSSGRAHLDPDHIWLPKGTTETLKNTTYTSSSLSAAHTGKPKIQSQK